MTSGATMRQRIVGVIVVGLMVAGVASGERARAQDDEALRAAAAAVVEALAGKDFVRLADLVDPRKGVLFSPYTLVAPQSQVTLTPEDLRRLASGERIVRTWGLYDGSALPIHLSFRDYFDRFVYDAPFATEGKVAVDERLGPGTTLDTTKDIWPEGRVVEYYFPGGDPSRGGMDWRSLRLVFEQSEGRWWLVGVVHDQWTI